MTVEYNAERTAIGQEGINRTIVFYYKTLGYKVTVFPINAEGLDLIAENEYEVLGIEVINWNERGYVNFDRLESMIDNWDKEEISLREQGDLRRYRRVLVYNFDSNIKGMLPYLKDQHVELQRMNTQVLPQQMQKTKGWIQ